MDRRNPLVEMLDMITEPLLSPLRQVMPRLGMFDMTPLVAIILLQFVAIPIVQRL